MSETPNNNIPYVPENTTDQAAGLNLALDAIDGVLQLSVLGIEDVPPGSPADGDRYIVGSGSGEWAGEDGRIARYIDDPGYWEFRDAYYCVNQDDECFYGFFNGVWHPMVCV